MTDVHDLYARIRHQPRRISAMMRVKNEAEFLYPAVCSIVEVVDEVVLVDNLSTDRTPSIIETLRAEYPGKVVAARYAYDVRRVGRETWELAENEETTDSPHLSSTFYNFCLAQCRMPYVLKWDGDMIALPAFLDHLERWRGSDKPILVFNGANVHPDREHLLAARETDRATLMAGLSVPGMPGWVCSLTYDFPEPRLFPKAYAAYDSGNLWTQRLSSPFYHRLLADRFRYRMREPGYLHMKFCKRDGLSNYSSDLQGVIVSNMTIGPPLSPGALSLLRRWHLGVSLSNSAGQIPDDAP